MIKLICYFAEDSSVDGCFVKMLSQDKDMNHTILKHDHETVTANIELPNGNYSVFVYDYNNNLPFYKPAVTTSYSVSFPSSMVTSRSAATTNIPTTVTATGTL